MTTTLDLDGLVTMFRWEPDAATPPWRRKFRYEGLQEFEVASDGSDYRSYLDGEPTYSLERKQPYWDALARAADAGVLADRVRRVTWPVTDYTRYEVEWGYLPNITATDRGNPREVVRIADDLDVTTYAPYLDRDWWLLTDFDDHTVLVVMIYGPDARFESAVVHDDPRLVAGFEVVRDTLVAGAEDVRTWWERHPELRRDGGLPLSAA